MAYQSMAYKVMIASPSDITSERHLIREVIHEWNSVHAEDRKVVLMPVGWETDASPDMGDRPQEIVNRQLLKNCDLLVAVFWTRLGSPTGTAPSGTVEEIEKHIAAGKPTMIYFSSVPVRLESVENEQYQALLEFKAKCKARGLIEEYESLTSFRDKFTRQLAQTVIRKLAGEQANVNPVIADQSEILPDLSDAARELLLEASNDPNGVIMQLRTMGGSHVATNSREFVEPKNPRSEAKWRGAIEDLLQQDLIEDRGLRGEVFNVTDKGYRIADLLKRDD